MTVLLHMISEDEVVVIRWWGWVKLRSTATSGSRLSDSLASIIPKRSIM